MDMLRAIARIIVEYRIAFGLLTIFLLIVSIYGLQSLQFETDLYKELPQNLQPIKDYQILQNEFMGGDNVIIVVKISGISEGGVYDIRDPKVIKSVYDLEQKLRQHPYVSGTFSIADVFIQSLGRLPKNEKEVRFVLNALPENVRSQLVSSDYTMTLIAVTISREKNQRALTRVYRDIQRDIEDTNFPENVEVAQTGSIGITYRILALLQSDLNRTMGIAFIMVILLLVYFYRSPVRALIPLTPLAFGVTMTLGFMGLAHIPLGITTTTVGAMIIGMGIDYGVHLTNRYYEERRKGMSIEDSAEEAIAETGKALLGAALTTIAGFAALSFSVLPALQRLGLVLVMGLTLAALNAVIVTPAVIMLEEDLMRLLRGHYEVPEIRAHSGVLAAIFSTLGRSIKRHPRTYLLLVVLLTLIFTYGVTQVTTEVRMDKMLPQGIPEIQAINDVNNEFGGMDEVDVIIQADDVRNPLLVRDIYRFEKSVLADSYYNNVFEGQSIADTVVREYGYIPDDRERISQALENSSLVTDDYSMTLLKFKGNFMGTTQGDFNRIMRYFEQEVRNADFPPGVSVRVTGDSYINYILNELTNRDIPRISTYGTFFVVLIVLLLFRSPKTSLAMILPMFLGALWTVGFMGLVKIPFDQTLAGVISMIVGLGVDYGMHLTHRFREELDNGNPHPIVTAVENVGPGILIGALTTAGGFLALLFGALTPIHNFGKALAFGIFASMTAAYLVTPSLLQLFYGKEIGGGEE
ncbi:hydrophobe/amphiphile efflux-3 (HAE3) family transporter [Thermococcus atlanticus]